MARTFSVRRQRGFTTIAMACFVALYLPIAVLVFYSFNAGESLASFDGMSLRWFKRPSRTSR
jgi:spermidine/putrescine transport system permease protein